MYNLIACQDCRHAYELAVNNSEGTILLYMCHNHDSREYGILHAYFFECRLRESELKTDERH